jgi:succinate-semialdehyde dehydrogenase/glutarate-semialdehyde dehydrogenase
MTLKFRNAGQTCICADRFIVHKSVEEEFVSKLADRVRRLNVGHGTKDGISMGPIISAQQVKILKEKVDAAISEGATCVVGGSPLAGLGPNYIYPSSSIWHSETFGPITAVKTFDTEEEVITLAKNTCTRLTSYFFTRDMSRVFRVSAALENGIVGVYAGIISSALASGLGREGSALGINEYLETKYVFLNA